jgi:PIN domain nuclease of toxin-antitoxin system
LIPLLLDTCALIWLAEEAPIAKAARDAVADAVADDRPIYISPISSWEIGLLISSGRLRLPLPPDAWFERVLAAPGVQLVEMPLRVLIASSFLPGIPPRDPVDRIIAATARNGDYRIMTRDRQLLDYAEQGHVKALAC